MKVRYIGTDDLTEDPQTEAFGTVFTKGKWTEVADVPPQLLTNPVFEVKGAQAAPDPEPAPEPEPEAPADPEPPVEPEPEASPPPE